MAPQQQPPNATVPEISEAEWDVMKVVWDHGPLTAGDVVNHLEGVRAWAPRTVKTLLTRLVRKAAVSMEPDGPNRFVYRAKVSQTAVVRQESKTFLSRVFDGAVAPAVVHFLSHHKLSADEIKELRQILDASAKKGGRP
jgi:BlaI family penicillinase repressor